jgi:hypothetical protein
MALRTGNKRALTGRSKLEGIWSIRLEPRHSLAFSLALMSKAAPSSPSWIRRI